MSKKTPAKNPAKTESTPEEKQALQAAQALEKRKKLTLRMTNYANRLLIEIDEKEKVEGSDDEVYKLGFIRRTLLWCFRQLIRASAWLLDRIEELANWVSDVLGTAGRPVVSLYDKAKTFVKGVEEAEGTKVAA